MVELRESSPLVSGECARILGEISLDLGQALFYSLCTCRELND